MVETLQTEPTRHTVVLADDHKLFRHALRKILEQRSEIEVVGEANDAAEALTVVSTLRPDILILDLGLPGRSGLEVILDLAEQQSSTRVIVVSMYAEEATVRQAYAAGAWAYVCKDWQPEILLQALMEVESGRVFVANQLSSIRNELLKLQTESPALELVSDPLSTLSKREREIFYLLAEGLPNRVIAKKLYISPRTVETHRARVIKKLGCQSTADLIRFAIRNSLLQA